MLRAPIPGGGLASSGVNNVKISVRRVSDTNYWAETGWNTSGSDLYIDATGSTSWKYGSGTEPSWTDANQYVIRAKAYDKGTVEETTGLL